MTTLKTTQKNKKLRNGIILAIGVVLLLGTGVVLMGSREEAGEAMATFTVQKGPLIISVLESGTIKARDQVIIKNEVEGRTSIIYLIDEGTRVKKGDLLVELDASSLLDTRIDQEISVQNAEASYINAKENLEVVKNQAESDKDAAKLTLDFAQVDLKKYQEGEYPNELKDSDAKIELAKEELKRAQDTYDWSNKLWEEKYISENELKADELAVTRCELDLALAEGNLELLKGYTYPRQIKQLESDIRQAEMALERTTRKANADVVQAEAELKAKEAEFNRQKDKLAKIEDQLKKTKLYAPADGLVIYATSAQRGGFRGSQEPLDEGQEVRERQELIYLPIGASSIAEVNVHEASLKKVHQGLPAVVTVDALPGKKYLGTVEFIAPLPDAQSMWMNPDLKVYNTQIAIDGQDTSLRTGMSCKAEIIVDQYSDALFVPVQSVLRVNNQPTVFVVNGSSVESRTVKTGLDNNRMIRILDGLKEGEKVLLTPPLKEATTESASQFLVSPENQGGESQQINDQIRDRLDNVQSRPNTPAATPASSDQGGPSNAGPGSMRQGGGGRPDFQNMTPEQREEMRKRFENMTPEQREQMRQMRQGRQGGQGQGQDRQRGERSQQEQDSSGEQQ